MSSAPVSSDSPSPSERTSFPIAQGRTKGYDRAAVDDFLARARGVFEGETGDALTSESVRRAAFPLTRHGYVIAAVDAALWALAALLFAPLGVAAFLAYKAFEKSRAPPKRVVSQPEKKSRKSKKKD